LETPLVDQVLNTNESSSVVVLAMPKILDNTEDPVAVTITGLQNFMKFD